MSNGEIEKPSRPVTRAQRRFGPDQLAELQRDDFRKLCHGLLLAEDTQIEHFKSCVDYDEFTLTVSALWRAHSVIVRIYYRSVTQQDLEEVREALKENDCIEALVLPNKLSEIPLSPPQRIRVISPSEMASRITSSALARWEDGKPTIAIDRLELDIELASQAALLDSIGIQWLPSLALNELPPKLQDIDQEPQDLLERKAYHLLTKSFRFSGVRYGEAKRGKRLPDALLYWPDGSPTVAMLDCKAAASGYKMTSDHLLRFVHYWETLSPIEEEQGRRLEHLIIVSSYFPGRKGSRHPFHYRAEEVLEKTGLKLSYLLASDLAWIASRIETIDMQLENRCLINWNKILGAGLVSADHLQLAIDEVAE